MTADRTQNRRWGSEKVWTTVETYQVMASGKFRHEPSEVLRAQAVLARFVELQTKGLDRADAIRIAEQEHPAPPTRTGYPTKADYDRRSE